MRLSGALLFALAFLFAAPPARADGNKALAHKAYQEGKKLYDVGEYAKALESFKRAYLAYEDPSFLFNMAQCYRLVGDKQEAVRAYKSYLRNFPEARNRNEVKRIVAELEESLAHEREAAEAQARAANSPPQGTLAPEHEPTPAVAPEVVVKQPPPPPRKKSRWWVWTLVGVVAAGAVVGIAVGVTQSQSTEPSLMKVRFP